MGLPQPATCLSPFGSCKVTSHGSCKVTSPFLVIEPGEKAASRFSTREDSMSLANDMRKRATLTYESRAQELYFPDWLASSLLSLSAWLCTKSCFIFYLFLEFAIISHII